MVLGRYPEDNMIEVDPSMIMTIIVTLIGSQGLWIVISKVTERKSATAQLIRGLAHEQIVSLGMKYIDRGWISNDEYDDFLNYLYIPYQKTGGNGLAERVKNEVDRLPFNNSTPPFTGPTPIVKDI